MINLEQLNLYRDGLDYLSQQMNSPEKMTFHPKIFEKTASKSHLGYEDLFAYKEVMMNHTLSEIKAVYTDTLDFSKKHPLYITFSKFDTQKERGQMLAKLEVLYEMFGLKMVGNKLSDFLPLMLQFLQAADLRNDSRVWENLQLVIMVIGDDTYEMISTPAESNNPYACAVSALKKMPKAHTAPLEGVENHA